MIDYIRNKRGQSQIITTVLIILLVLSAIIIVWQVIDNSINPQGMETAKEVCDNPEVLKQDRLKVWEAYDSLGCTIAYKYEEETNAPMGWDSRNSEWLSVCDELNNVFQNISAREKNPVCKLVPVN